MITITVTIGINPMAKINIFGGDFLSEYMILFITVIAFVFGWIVGAFLMLTAFHYIPKRFPIRPRKNKRLEKKYKNAPYYHSNKTEKEDNDFDEIYDYDDEEDDEEDYEANEESEGYDDEDLDAIPSESDNDVGGGLLRKRLGKNKESWTKFCCDLENKDEKEHIRNSRKKEDASYHYTKRKK